MDRETVNAAGTAVRRLMRKRQAEAHAHAIERDAWGWAPPDPDLLALADKCEDVYYGRRPEADDLADCLAAVLGDGWEPCGLKESPIPLNLGRTRSTDL